MQIQKRRRPAFRNATKLAGAAAATAAAGAGAGNQAHAAIVQKPGAIYATNAVVTIDYNTDTHNEFAVGSLTAVAPVRHVIKRQEDVANGQGGAPGSSMFLSANNDPAALTFGTTIGSTPAAGTTWSSDFDIDGNGVDGQDDAILRDADSPQHGNFTEQSSATQYLGVQFAFFDSPSEIHYGWIGVRNINTTTGTGEVTNYAYETTPGASINAGVPEPTGLGLLAMGAVGLAARRKR